MRPSGFLTERGGQKLRVFQEAKPMFCICLAFVACQKLRQQSLGVVEGEHCVCSGLVCQSAALHARC